MDHENERWIKVYTRDTGGWLDLSWQARGLALELSRKLDADGKLPLGRRGLQSLAGVVRGRWEDLCPFVDELLTDGRFEVLEGNVLWDPEHKTRQSAVSSAALRKKTQRDRDALSRDVTLSHAASRDVTRRHECHDQIRSEEIRSDLNDTAAPPAPPSDVGPKAKSKSRGTRLPEGWTPSAATLEWAKGERVAAPLAELAEFADFWRAQPGARGVKLDWDATYRNRLRQVSARAVEGTNRLEQFRRDKLGVAPKPQDSRKTFQERDAWVTEAGAPDPEAQARLNKLLGKVGT